MNATTKIYDINDTFPFDKIEIMKPMNRNGTYFMRLEANGNPIYVQPPKCFLKQGFTKSGKKLFCDFVFSTENEKFLEWLEKFEERCYLQIFENREKWFDPILEKHEIEEYMTSPYKMYKSGKYYILRTDVPTNLGKCEIKIYDEHECEIEPEHLKENMNAITIMEFKGIKCSVRSFQFEIELKQMLIVEPVRIFEKLVIKGITSNAIPAHVTHTSNDTINTNSEISNSYKENISEQSILAINKLDEEKLDNEENDKYIDKEQINSVDVDFDGGSEENKEINNTIEDGYINDMDGKKNINLVEINELPVVSNEPMEFDIDLAQLEENIEDAPVHLKNKNDIYYEKYKEAKKKARESKILALTHYLEAKRIKSTYLENFDFKDDSDEEDIGIDENTLDIEEL